MANYNVPIVDHSNEVSTFSFRVSDTETDINLTSLFNAVDGVSLGNAGISTLNISAEKDQGSGAPAANNFAQRELKWLIRYIDDVTGRKYRAELPCADLNLLAGNTDFMDMSAGAGLALKNALESYGKSQDGNAITVVSAEVVGRNT